MAENGQKRLANGQFKRGTPGGPGRPKGSSNKLGLADKYRIDDLLEKCGEYLETNFEELSKRQVIDIFKALIEYRLPKMSRVETDNRIDVSKLTDSQVDELIKRIAAQHG